MSIRQFLSLAVCALGIPAWAQTAPAVAPPSGTPISLQAALQAARGNLEVSIARRGFDAARADILAANHAPLPVLSGKAASIDLQNGVGGGNVLTQKRIDKSIGIDWTWERGDKRTLRTQAAQRGADAAQADVDSVQADQLQATVGAFYDLLAAQQRQQEVDAIARSAEQLAGSANRRVQAGDLAAQEAARTEIEAQRARADVTAAQLDRQRAALGLAQLTGQPLGTLPAAQADWPATQTLLAADQDIAPLVEARSEVRAAQARVDAAQSVLDGAKALRKSDVTVGASFDHYPGTSTRQLELRASIPLQWGYSYQGEIGRAQAEYYQAQDALEKARRVTAIDLQALQQTLRNAGERLRGYDTDILPRARRVADGAELAFNRGASSLTDLLDARRILRATLLDALTARADYAKARGAWLLRTQPQTLVPAS